MIKTVSIPYLDGRTMKYEKLRAAVFGNFLIHRPVEGRPGYTVSHKHSRKWLATFASLLQARDFANYMVAVWKRRKRAHKLPAKIVAKAKAKRLELYIRER